MIETKTSTAAPKPAAPKSPTGIKQSAAPTTVKRAAPKTAPATKVTAPKKSQTPKAVSTTTQTKKVPRIKAGQNWACEICGMAIVVDACGCIQDHVFLCCGQEMNRGKSKKAKKKKAKKKK